MTKNAIEFKIKSPVYFPYDQITLMICDAVCYFSNQE